MTRNEIDARTAFRQVSAMRRHNRRGSRACQALLEVFEPRVLLSGTFLPGNFVGTWALGGLNKAGVLTSDGVSAITAGAWTNADGSATSIVAGTNSSYMMSSVGAVGMSLQTDTVGTTMSLSGIMNATRDIMALNETAAGVPSFNGLDVLVNHTGTFASSNLTGTWNIAAQDFRGTITINASGHVTSGLIYLETTQQSKSVTGGTATLNADGTGTLSFTTGFGTSSAYHTVSMAITMNAAKDTLVANNAAIGEAATAPQTGTVPAELAVLVKVAGTYASTDVAGITWTMKSALGSGTITFNRNGTITGAMTTDEGVARTLTGNYTVGGNGSLIINFVSTAGANVLHFSLYGAINQSRNVVALDRAIGNSGTNSSLTVLTRAADHAPTERLVAVLPQGAYQASAVTIDFPTLATATSVNDFDHDTVSFLITAAPVASGTLSIDHGGVVTAVSPGSTMMFSTDTLIWTPAATAKGQANAFSIQATDGELSAANATKIFLNTTAQPLVSAIATKGVALEADAGSHAGDGKIQIQRAGGIQTVPTTITLSVATGAGQAVQGVNYNLLAPDGVTVLSSTSPTVVIPAGQSSVTLTVHPLEDNTVDPTLAVQVTVAPDPNATSSSYTPSVHATAHVNVIDDHPLVSITDRVTSITEGNASVSTFFVERLAAQGANLNNSLTVNLSYTGSFNTGADLIAPASVTFAPGQVKKVVTVTTLDDGIADPTQTLTATVSGAGFVISGPASATVNVRDASPTVSMSVKNATALEATPSQHPARFTFHRTGPTTNALTVDFTTASGGTFGTLGTNYTLTDASGHSLTTSVVIPAGVRDAVVTLTPIDDFANDPTLHPAITLVQDAGTTYHLGTSQVILNILNNNRPPTIANATVSQGTTLNTAITLSFSQLVTASGAALATGETNGTLQLKVAAKFLGTLQLIPSGSLTPTSAPAGTVINAGDKLVWTPPVGAQGVTVKAFSLAAVDGTVTSLTRSLFSVAIT